MLHDHLLNIAGSEWLIIIFVALVVILGTGRMPGAARKLGRAVNEFNRAKNDIQQQVSEATSEGAKKAPEISGPVQTEREKLEMMARAIGARTEGRTDEQLRADIDKILNNGGAGGDGDNDDNGGAGGDGDNDDNGGAGDRKDSGSQSRPAKT